MKLFHCSELDVGNFSGNFPHLKNFLRKSRSSGVQPESSRGGAGGRISQSRSLWPHLAIGRSTPRAGWRLGTGTRRLLSGGAGFGSPEHPTDSTVLTLWRLSDRRLRRRTPLTFGPSSIASQPCGLGKVPDSERALSFFTCKTYCLRLA